MAAGDINYKRIRSGLSDMDVVGGRMDYDTSATAGTQIKWSFLNSNQIRLFNGFSWELVKVASEPTLLNTAYELDGSTSLTYSVIYDVFAEYSSSTAFTLKCTPWAVSTAGSSARVAAYAGGTTYHKGMRVTSSSHSFVYINAAATSGHTPTVGGDTYWDDNGTVITGDFAGLYQHEGVYVSGNSATGKTRRWLGIVMLSNESGAKFKHASNYRYVSNFYNLQTVSIDSLSNAADYAYTTNALRDVPMGTTGTYGYFISCVSKSFAVSGSLLAVSSGTYACLHYIYLVDTSLCVGILNYAALGAYGGGDSISGSSTTGAGFYYLRHRELGAAGCGNTRCNATPLVVSTIGA